jgi:hypothetical protein
VPVDASLGSLDDASEQFASLSQLLEQLQSKVKIVIENRLLKNMTADGEDGV